MSAQGIISTIVIEGKEVEKKEYERVTFYFLDNFLREEEEASVMVRGYRNDDGSWSYSAYEWIEANLDKGTDMDEIVKERRTVPNTEAFEIAAEEFVAMCIY